MRIAIDGRSIVRPDVGRVSGINQYTSCMIDALVDVAADDTFVVFLDSDVPSEQVRAMIRGRSNIEARQDASLLRAVPYVGAHLMLPSAIHAERIDLFFAPTGLIPLGLRIPSVGFIHDLFILEHPEWFPDSAIQQVFTLKLVLPRSLDHARLLLTPSAAVRSDLIRAFPKTKQKTVVVHEGITICSPQPERQIHGRYIVSVATLEPRKNFLFALRAFEALLSRDPSLSKSLQYVIAGTPGWGAEPILEAIDHINARWRQYRPDGVVRYLGSVTDAERCSLYQHAELYLCTSFAEGFGLPPLEAMGVGTAVVTTSVGVIPEVAKGSVAIISESDVPSTATILLKLLNDQVARRRLAEAGRAAVAQFTWRRSAEQTLTHFRSVC